MVKLTLQLVQKLEKNSKSPIHKRTHIYLNNKRIGEIAEDFHKNALELTVMYLHNNLLTTAANLSFLVNLTHLHLQWNRITSLHDFHDLPHLTNLYVGHNHINFLDGPTGVPKLRVLHVQNQKFLGTVTNFSLKLQTLIELSISVIELNVSGNNITSFNEFRQLHKLIHLDVSHNFISDMNDVCCTMRTLKNLKTLQIEKNPVSNRRKYEYEIIASSPNLERINDKEVTATNRIFLQSLKLVKIQQKRQQRNAKKMEFSSVTKSFVHQLPPEFREIVSGSAIHSNQNVDQF